MTYEELCKDERVGERLKKYMCQIACPGEGCKICTANITLSFLWAWWCEVCGVSADDWTFAINELHFWKQQASLVFESLEHALLTAILERVK